MRTASTLDGIFVATKSEKLGHIQVTLNQLCINHWDWMAPPLSLKVLEWDTAELLAKSRSLSLQSRWPGTGDLPAPQLQRGPWQLRPSNHQSDFFFKAITKDIWSKFGFHVQVRHNSLKLLSYRSLSCFGLTIDVYSWQHYRHLWSSGLVMCGGWQ